MSTVIFTSITLILAGAIVLVVAYHLVGIYLNLKKTADNLELLAGGLVQINQNTAPLGDGIGQLNGGLSVLLEDFKGALGNLTQLTKSAKDESTPNRKSASNLAGASRKLSGGSKHWAPSKKS
jgi:X-X-X-Leu-X-X-Gly heptad repeat protein